MSAENNRQRARRAAAAVVATISGHWALAQANFPPPPFSPAPVQRFEYDALGNRTLAARVLGAADAGVLISTYDSLSRLSSQRDGAGGLTRLGRNARGEVTEVTDPLALVTRYSRDGLGQPYRESSPDTGTTLRTFDAAGRVVTSMDARGVLSSWQYDALGRPLQLVRSGSGFATQAFAWRYDETDSGTSFGIGRLTTSVFPYGSRRYAYDAQGRIARESLGLALPGLPKALSFFGATTSYSYDSAGRMASITYPSGRTLRFLISNGQVAAMTLTSADGSSTSTLVDQLQWEPTGEVRSWRWASVAGTPTHQIVRDLYGRIVRQPLGPVVRDIVYDEHDRVAGYTHRLTDTAQAVPALDQSFGYDEADRLRSWTGATGSVTINYDANGNRTSYTSDGMTQWLGRFSGSNRLSIAPNPLRTVQYDAAGNVAGDSSGLTLTHDASGQLAGSARSQMSSTNYFDGTGQRVAKRWSSPDLWSESAVSASYSGIVADTSTLTSYVYDIQGRLIAELSGGFAASGWTEYYWLGDTLIAAYREGASPELVFVHSDHLGAPRAIVDAAGALRWTWFADPFGLSAPNESPSGLTPVSFNLRLPGQYFDAESGLYYNWHRFYEAGSGRYTQSDPIGLEGGINTYAYAYGNPLSYTDPDGLNPVVRGIVAGAKKVRDVWRDTNFDGPRPSRTKPGEGMVCQIRYKQQPVFRIDVHPLDPTDRTPVPHWHMAPDMQRHREMPEFMGDWMRSILGGGG